MSEKKQIQITPSQQSLDKGKNAVEYAQRLVNMSLQEIWNIAYTSGYEDAMTENNKGKKDGN